MTVASMKIATARPMPICLMSRLCSVAKMAKTATMTIAALVTTLAVPLIPWATASLVLMPPSTSSLTRLRMKT